MISSALIILACLAAATLLLTAALSPIETLSWWAGWTEREVEDAGDDVSSPRATGPSATPAPERYIVYLSGVASLSGRIAVPREKAFLKGLREALPGSAVIADVFPYSPAGLPLLASPRIFERLWRRIQKSKLEGRHGILSILINIRNIFQVMVSADHRYGPIFNQGAANVIETSLLEAGYGRGSGVPVTIIGYSGGAQVAVGAAPFLKARLGAPIDVISIGGVMASDPGFRVVRKFHHLYGEGDHVQRLGAVMFPERWRAMGHSEWNRARRQGRMVAHPMKTVIHAGARGYFGLVKTDGVSNNARTLERVVKILNAGSLP